MNLHRRTAVAAIAGTAALGGRAWGQAAGRVPRLGWLGTIDSRQEPYSRAFVQRLKELGYEDGRQLTIDFRHAGGVLDALPRVAAQLAEARPDVYFVGGVEDSLVAVKAVGGNAPIVITATDFDPVSAGHVSSLARPGGRVTGVTMMQSVLPAKRLELLREMLPQARRIGVFSTAATMGQLEVTREAARRLGLTLQVFEFRREPFDFAAAFAEAARLRCDALMILGSALFVPSRRKIGELAASSRIPTMLHQSQWVEVGGLMSYGFSFIDAYQRAAEQVVAILKGAKAGDIPMEQGAKFELVVNLRTARAMGLAIPQSIMLRADRVIE